MNHIEILRFLTRGNKTLFDVPSSVQAIYLDSFPKPKDDIERSFFQYKCQNFFSSDWKEILLNVIGIFIFFPALFFYMFRMIIVPKKDKKNAITDLNGMPEIIPVELSQRYDITFIGNNPIGALYVSDLSFIIPIFFRYFPAGFFSFKAMAKVAQYRQLIHMYSPDCIIAHLEYSFSSSILTGFCAKMGIKHINVMHGEKLFNIIDAFFRFDECFVWSEHYVRLFTDLMAEHSQFRISLPLSMQINLLSHNNVAAWADYKYYLASFSENQIIGIVNSLSFVRRQGKSIKYRIHPRHRNLKLILKYVNQKDIEYPEDVSIIDSISNCSVVIGAYSTVLNQAFCSGRSVVLDDVTFKEQYDRLEDLRYWLIGENCRRLSEMQ